jgi:hypothetical protein
MPVTRLMVPLFLSLLVIGGAATAQAPPVWRFTEELRIGSEADDVTGFNEIRGLLVDAKGNIWVLEASASTQEIRIFDAAGKHLRTVGRNGKGPGEFTYADGMALAPNGLIWVHDPKNARFSIFDQDGKFVRQQLAPSNGYGYIWAGGIDRQGRIWDQIFYRDPKNPELSLMRRALPDWSKVDTLALPPCNIPGRAREESAFKLPQGFAAVPYYPGPVAAADYDDGSLWCAPTSAKYEFLRLRIGGTDTVARFSGRAEPVQVSPAERDSAIAKVKQFMKRAGEASLDWSRIPRVKPLLVSPFIDGEGRLWVRRTAAGGTSAYDIFTREGRPVATLTVPLPLNGWLRPVIVKNMGYFILQEEGEVPYVVRGRIGPPR